MLNPTTEVETASSPARDGVGGLNGTSTVVSVSDIHGYLRSARTALTVLGDHPDFDPVVEQARGRKLHWADNDYVLVFNGDLIDRGPDSDRVLELVARLAREAGPERVRVTLGNHKMGLLTPDRFGWERWFSGSRSPAERRGFVERVRAGHVVAAYEGHRVTYAHAGRPEPYEAAALNDDLAAAVERLSAALETAEEPQVQQEVIDSYPAVLGLGGRTGRGPGAGVAWLDFEYMPEDAPPQVVGHTRQDNPTREGNVVCENVIRNNRRADGGEAVLVETPDQLVAVGRDGEDGVRDHDFSLPDAETVEA